MGDFILVASSLDLAGATMIGYLKSKHGYVLSPHHGFDGKKGVPPNYRVFVSDLHSSKLLVVDDSLLTLETLDVPFPDAKAFVFLSKHRSDSEIPTLTCHCTGNFADAPYGGRPKEIAIALPSLQKAYINAISKTSISGYDVIIEATHHGPTSLKKPVLFVELGSSEKQWSDNEAAKGICDSLLGVLEGFEPCSKVGIGIGGTHYPIKFNKLLLKSEFGLAAVASKHVLGAIDEAMLLQMIEKSAEKVTHIVLDMKGLGSHKERILTMVQNSDLEIIKL